MNICEQTKIRMLEGAVLSAEEQKHLEACPDCRSLAAFAERMEQLPAMEDEVPAYLDAAVLQAAGVPVKKSRWKMIVLKVAIPAAAAFAFVSGLLFYHSSETTARTTGVSQKVVVKKIEQTKQIAVITKEKSSSAAREESLSAERFDEQIFSLALDVGTGMNSFSETWDSVSETTDTLI